MFRRLLCWFSLLVVALLLGQALVLSSAFTNRHLLVWLAFAVLGVAVTAVFSAILTNQFRRPVRELVEGVSRLNKGGVGPRIVATDDAELIRLAEMFNGTSEELTGHIARLEQDRQQLRTILSSMVEGVVALDADQRILFANERASALLELPTPAPEGRYLWEVVRHRPLLDAVFKAQQRSGPHREEVNWIGATTRSLTVHAARLPGALPRGTVLVLHDTTELRRLERLRQDFVANVSHELKTPLSVIKVCVETLLDGAVEDAHHRGRFLEQIARQSDRLHALILDLLSLARIESGAELFEYTGVAVEPLVRACVDRHRARVMAKQQMLVVSAPPERVHVWADEEALDQILENLVDNALKYTPEGGRIEVGWHCQEGQVRIEVTDTGIGIPAADLPRIFERFYRVDRARSRELGGTGLGLSIVKHLVQAMRGNIRATSQIGCGTTFTVWLPVALGEFSHEAGNDNVFPMLQPGEASPVP